MALLASLSGFLVLIHAVAGQLRVDALLSSIGRVARTRLRRQSLHAGERRASTPVTPVAVESACDARVIRYRGEPGQLVDVAVTELRRIARKNKSQITLLVRVGDGVSASAAVAHVLGPAPSDRALSRCLLVRTERSLAHDPLYALRLLADIGLRALSAAVNDPTTAVRALDEIEDVLRTASRLPLGAARHVSGEGCVVLPRPTWADIVDLALLEILEAGIHAPQVTRRPTALLADLLADLPEQSSSPLLRYQRHLTAAISRTVSVEDQSVWLTADRQGIGGSR